MYPIYRILTNLIILILPIVIFYRILNGKEDSKRFMEKFCIYKKKNKFKSIWFHAASVGEMKSIIPIIKKFEKFNKVKKIILTTSTLSSAKIFEKLNLKKTSHKYFPIDVNFLNLKFINYWKPEVAIFVESEIWPNMINNLNKKKIPVIILNARITKNTFKKWKIFSNFAKEIFGKISLALPQNSDTKKYLKKLGVKNIQFAGNLKYYGENNILKKKDLFNNNSFKNFKIWCAASTHENEEIFVGKLHKKIKKIEKDLLTVIIPRHINRSTKIIDQLMKLNLSVVTRSSNKSINQNTDIFLVDTYGESSTFFNLSNITFMGGSIINRGGQNPLEPARLGNYIISGPNVYNFQEIYSFLNKNKMALNSSNIETMRKIILKKLNKKAASKNKNKILKIGNKILNKNISYLKMYFI